MILLQVGQLFSQALDLHLQVGLGQGQLVQHPAQAVDVSIHALAEGHLILVPETSMLQLLAITYKGGAPDEGRDYLKSKYKLTLYHGNIYCILIHKGVLVV